MKDEQLTTWRKEIKSCMKGNKDSWVNVVSCTISNEELDREFDYGYGGTNGAPFCLWTHTRIYFPVCYDGAEWCGSASRNPDGKSLNHQGGG